MRRTALASLLALYASPGALGPLRGFTDRFSSRFAELVHDVDDGVAAKGAELLALLVKEGELGAEAVGDAFRLLTDDAPAVRGAAAGLVAGLLCPGGVCGEGAEGGDAPARGRTRERAAVTPAAQLDGMLGVLERLARPPTFGVEEVRGAWGLG